MQAWLAAVLVGCILAAEAEPEKIHMLSSRPLGQFLIWARPRCRLLAHSHLHHKFSPSRHPSFCHKAVHRLFLFPCLLNLNEATDWIDTLSSISSLLPVLHIHLLDQVLALFLPRRRLPGLRLLAE